MFLQGGKALVRWDIHLSVGLNICPLGLGICPLACLFAAFFSQESSKRRLGLFSGGLDAIDGIMETALLLNNHYIRTYFYVFFMPSRLVASRFSLLRASCPSSTHGHH
jgi:hypothetical protein